MKNPFPKASKNMKMSLIGLIASENSFPGQQATAKAKTLSCHTLLEASSRNIKCHKYSANAGVSQKPIQTV